jgi:HEAT repeat protein
VKRRPKLEFLIVVAAGIGTTCWLVLRTRDPVYQGQTLSYWFDQFNTTNRPQAAMAIRQIGTNAVPFLLEKAKSKDGDTLYERLYRTIYFRAPTILQRRLALPNPIENTYDYRVASALQLLGLPAVPQLIEAMEDRNSKVRLAAVRVTGLIGPEANTAVPTLAKLVNDSNGEVRVEAVSALSIMGPNKKLAIPALIGALNDSNRGPKPGMTVYVKENAARVLGEIGPEARAAVSPLTKLLSDTNSYAREQAAIALWRINRDTNVIPVLIAELESASEAPAYGRILTALREMGRSATAAVPVILKTIKDRRGMPNDHGIDIRAVGLKTLEEINPEAATKAGLE